VKIIFQIFAMMHEIWIGTKSYQIVRVFYVHHTMHSLLTCDEVIALDNLNWIFILFSIEHILNPMSIT
jgi:hypothetical protein